MKILIVEDEEGLRKALARSLEDEGYLVDQAEDGELGYDMALTGIYDLLLLDLMLPLMDGFEILKRIRSKMINVPVIILTARGELDDKIKGMDTGADDYLTKPIEIEELFARIRMVSRRGKGRELDNRLHVGSTALHTSTYELSSAVTGESIKLGRTEYQVLEYLMTNAGQVMSREQITEKVWGFDSEAEYNNVDVYISFLRKKLKFVGADLKIGAVRGVGYILEEEP